MGVVIFDLVQDVEAAFLPFVIPDSIWNESIKISRNSILQSIVERLCTPFL